MATPMVYLRSRFHDIDLGLATNRRDHQVSPQVTRRTTSSSSTTVMSLDAGVLRMTTLGSVVNANAKTAKIARFRQTRSCGVSVI